MDHNIHPVIAGPKDSRIVAAYNLRHHTDAHKAYCCFDCSDLDTGLHFDVPNWNIHHNPLGESFDLGAGMYYSNLCKYWSLGCKIVRYDLD